MNPNITKKLFPVNDQFFLDLKKQWFEEQQSWAPAEDFVGVAEEWFKSSKINDIQGWEQFPCTDVIVGCTHYIESLILKYGWDGIQILPDEYAYYYLVGGKYGNKVGDLLPNTPLILSLPNWKYADLRPNWEDILKECEEKNIDIHIDFAWITTAIDINIDLNHPNIKSFAMSLSKFSLEWNRIGLRWSRQRSADSITMFNHYYGSPNSALTSCGIFMINNIPRDYLWNTYGKMHYQVCNELNLFPTKLIHVAHTPEHESVGIGNILSSL